MTTLSLSRRTLLASAAATGGALLLSAQRAPSSTGFADAARYNAQRNGVSMLVEQNRRVLFEDYPGDGRVDAGWELASGTKSFSGIIAAALVHDGLLSLDEPCVNSIPAWRGDRARSAITIRQLLSLTSGLAPGQVGRVPTFAEAVATPSQATAGTQFAYGPTPFQIFGAIVAAKLTAARTGDADALAYLQRRIFTPLNIRPQRWRRTSAGEPHLPSGAALTARDWARFGRFVLDAARRQPQTGDPALDHASLMACFAPSNVNPGYGLTWWLPNPGLIGPSDNRQRRRGGNATGISEDMAALSHLGPNWMAAGAGNQRLYLVPDRNLVIVRQANRLFASSRGDWSDVEFARGVLAGL